MNTTTTAHPAASAVQSSTPVVSAAVVVTPEMREAVVDVVNRKLAEDCGLDYRLSPASDGSHLLLSDDDGRMLLWVYAHDNVSGFHWSGWVTADGRACETLSEVEEAMGL